MQFEPIDKWTPPEQPDFIRNFPQPRMFSNRGSFVWWWYMFFFKEDGVRKQIVAYWTTKSYENVDVNGVNWGPAANIKGTTGRGTMNGIDGMPSATETPGDYSYDGMTTFWYWDGERFHETPPKVSRFETKADDDQFEISSDDVQHTADRESFFLRFCRDPDEFDLRVEECGEMPPPVGYKRTFLLKKIFKNRKMGFDALKIYTVPWKGTLSTNGHEREVSGSLYMQHITLNTKAFPWLWGVFHRDDGSYLTYFTSFAGRYMFRRSAECKPSYDNKFTYMNKNFNYTPKGQETKRFKHITYEVFREGTGLPEFEVTGMIGEREGKAPGKEEYLKARFRTLGKTTYAFDRKKPLWHSKFFYNEFPSEVVWLEYTDEDGKVHRDDGSAWTGNCEYSWGILGN